MSIVVGSFKTTESAEAAAAELDTAKMIEHKVLLAGQPEESELDAVQAAVETGFVPRSERDHFVQQLKDGQSLVAVRPPFMRAIKAMGILESHGAETSSHTEDTRPIRSNAAPFSAALGIDTLKSSKSTTDLSRASPFSFRKFLGLGLLSDNPAPLSSRFNLPLLKSPKASWDKSMGMSLLSDEPAPLSKRFNWTTVYPRKQDWQKSFGMPLLSNDPTPLSNFFGFKVLSDKQ